MTTMTLEQNNFLNAQIARLGVNYNGFEMYAKHLIVIGYAGEIGGVVTPKGEWHPVTAYTYWENEEEVEVTLGEAAVELIKTL